MPPYVPHTHDLTPELYAVSLSSEEGMALSDLSPVVTTESHTAHVKDVVG